MSRRTTEFKRKVAQQARTGGISPSEIIPAMHAKSTGRKTIYVRVDGVDEEGKKTKVGARIKGKGSGLVCSLPASPETYARLERLCK